MIIDPKQTVKQPGRLRAAPAVFFAGVFFQIESDAQPLKEA